MRRLQRLLRLSLSLRHTCKRLLLQATQQWMQSLPPWKMHHPVLQK